MKTNDNILECYDKMFPKWANILLATVVFVSAFYFFKYDTVAFYICIAMCLLLVVLTLTHKSTKEPKLTIDNYNIKTTLGQTYSIKSISNADLIVKGKWVRNKSNYIRLHFKNNTTTEFQVDYLDKKPKEIIDNLLGKILADT